MPIYVYQCKSCNKEHEVFKTIANITRLEECPQCREPMTKMVTAANVQPGVTPRFHRR